MFRVFFLIPEKKSKGDKNHHVILQRKNAGVILWINKNHYTISGFCCIKKEITRI